MFIGLYTLASTADIYLSPSLETLTVKFGLSDSLAGVTLLAFGNGAPDVFSSISAASNADGNGGADVNKSVSILLGGTFFITCVVFSLSTNAANINEDPNGTPIKRIKVTPRFFLRDIIFFMITCIYLLIIFLFIHEFDIFLAVGLLAIYAIYVILVVVQSKTSSRDNEEAEQDEKANIFNEMMTLQKKASKAHIEFDTVDEVA